MHKSYPERYPSAEELKEFLSDIKSKAYHEDIIRKVTENIQDLPEIECILLMGSLGKRGGDIFSDIDFVVIHQGGTDESRILRKKIVERIEETCQVLYSYSTGYQNLDDIIFMHPLVKFELNIRTVEISMRDWKCGETEILFDRKGLGKQIQDETKKIAFKIEKVLPWLGNSAINLPTMFYLASAFVIRGEYVTAMDGYDWIRSELLRVSGWLLGQWDEGPRRAEMRFPPEVLSFYWDSRVMKPDEILHTLPILMDWYEKWMIPRFEELEISHSGYQIKELREIIPYLGTKITE
ncbi:MAG: hypothetical protein RTU30_03155 [Candidatus Thorarchaeota archaeon]